MQVHPLGDAPCSTSPPPKCHSEAHNSKEEWEGGTMQMSACGCGWVGVGGVCVKRTGRARAWRCPLPDGAEVAETLRRCAVGYFRTYALVRVVSRKLPTLSQSVLPLLSSLVWVFRNQSTTSLVPSQWGNVFSVGQSGTLVPLLTNADSAPRRPSHAGAGDASGLVIHAEGGGGSKKGQRRGFPGPSPQRQGF